MRMGEKGPAETAGGGGLIYRVTDDDARMETAVTLAKRLANGPTLALAALRGAIAQSEGNDFSTQLEVEAVLQSRLADSADCVEGISAFLAKRPAEFKGE